MFFDGDCLLCNRTVRWLVRNEKNTQGEKKLHFAPLKGVTAAENLDAELLKEPFDSLVFRSSKGDVKVGARAVRELRRFLRPAAAFQLLFVREFSYRIVAATRGVWGRKKYDACNYSYIDPDRILD